MSVRTVLLLIVALAAAAGTALFARGWIAQQQAAFKARPAAVAQPLQDVVRVLVAKDTMEAGRFVRADDLRWAPWPKDGVAEGYVTEAAPAPEGKKPGKARFDGAVVRARITAGEPVTALKLVQPGERGFLSAVLDPGKRAVSVPVDATTGIAGFIFPGDWVDVIFTGHLQVDRKAGEGSEGSKTKRIDFSETLLSDVRVIAIDQKVETGDGKAKVAKTATLEVTPKAVEKIALALKMGGLSLSLHSLAREQDSFAQVARAVGADPEEAETEGSYTLEHELLYILKDKRFQAGHGRRGINVIRADKAEQAHY